MNISQAQDSQKRTPNLFKTNHLQWAEQRTEISFLVGAALSWKVGVIFRI